MAQFNTEFKIPKHNIKKLGKVFDLDTIESDNYELIVLKNSEGLIVNQLSTVNSAILSKEADNYTRANVEMSISENSKGYDITPEIINVEATGIVTIAALLIVKKSSQDIFACYVSNKSMNIVGSFNLSSQDVFMELSIV